MSMTISYSITLQGSKSSLSLFIVSCHYGHFGASYSLCHVGLMYARGYDSIACAEGYIWDFLEGGDRHVL